MIQPGSYDITIQQGASFGQVFQFNDSVGDPIDMTGYTVAAEIWDDNKRNKYVDFTVSWLEQDQGRFSITLTPVQTHTIPDSGFWDILVTNPDGSKDYWIRGAANLAVGYTE